jgi:hypothetical protein
MRKRENEKLIWRKWHNDRKMRYTPNRSLRWLYPDQVQGVSRSAGLSVAATPPRFDGQTISERFFSVKRFSSAVHDHDRLAGRNGRVPKGKYKESCQYHFLIIKYIYQQATSHGNISERNPFCVCPSSR